MLVDSENKFLNIEIGRQGNAGNELNEIQDGVKADIENEILDDMSKGNESPG